MIMFAMVIYDCVTIWILFSWWLRLTSPVGWTRTGVDQLMPVEDARGLAHGFQR